MFSLAIWVFTGVTVGLIARAIRSEHDRRPGYILVAMGAFGAILGGLIAAAIWPTWVSDPQLGRDVFPGWVLSAVGASAVVGVFLSVSGPRESHHRA